MPREARRSRARVYFGLNSPLRHARAKTACFRGSRSAVSDAGLGCERIPYLNKSIPFDCAQRLQAASGVKQSASSGTLVFCFLPPIFAINWFSEYNHPFLIHQGLQMISRVQSGAVLGIDGYSVEVEVNLATGIPGHCGVY